MPLIGSKGRSELDCILATRRAEKRAEAILIGLVILATVTILIIGILNA